MVLRVALIGLHLSPWALGNEPGPHAVCHIDLLILAWTLPLPPHVSLVQQVSNLNKRPSVFRELEALQAALTDTSSQRSELSVLKLKENWGGKKLQMPWPSLTLLYPPLPRLQPSSSGETHPTASKRGMSP